MSEHLDEAAFELRAIREDQQAETPEKTMARTNPAALDRANAMMAAIDRGELIDGYNAASCNDGCGRVIEWKNFDEGGPDWMQPTGFRCESCEQWSADECGDRKRKACRDCITYGIGLEVKEAAEALENALFARTDLDAARRLNAQIVALTHTLGRRLRLAANKAPEEAA